MDQCPVPGLLRSYCSTHIYRSELLKSTLPAAWESGCFFTWFFLLRVWLSANFGMVLMYNTPNPWNKGFQELKPCSEAEQKHIKGSAGKHRFQHLSHHWPQAPGRAQGYGPFLMTSEVVMGWGTDRLSLHSKDWAQCPHPPSFPRGAGRRRTQETTSTGSTHAERRTKERSNWSNSMNITPYGIFWKGHNKN